MRKWREFFPAYCIETEFVLSRRPGKKMKRQIAKQCPRWVDSIRFWRGVYRRISPCGAIFVVAGGPDEFVVDIFPIEDAWRYTAHMQKGLGQYHALVAARVTP
jgi:hypothetical protein